jgi:4-carboxymuconolactone decarboxylase
MEEMSRIMNKKLTIILAGIFVSMFNIATILGARTMKNEGLNAKQEKIVTIAAFTAKGDLEQLKTALYAYAGFPRSLNGIFTFMGVMEEREQKSIKDEIGKEASPLPTNINKDKYGEEVLGKLTGTQVAPVKSGYQLFAPAIDTFLKEHLFTDIFGRDNLDIQSREIATISALASMEGVNPMLQFHLNAGMNVGLTEAQLRSLISVIESRVGKKEADNANEVLSKVLSNRGK